MGNTLLLLKWITILLFMISFVKISLGDEEKEEKKEQFHCHTCNSGNPEEPNVNCLGNSSVNYPTTWKANCTEKCFIRTNVLYPGTTYRGCTDLFPQLPKPLAEDGCYKYYLDSWCLCGTELCNGDPMGKPQDKELDEHLWETTGENGLVTNSAQKYRVPIAALTFSALVCQWIRK